MKDTPVVLSISMLVSGREEMAKSLESLHYFRDAFPCELILVDTGCNAEQRALAEKYADKIIDFEWCNDFAAARNAGLKEATGEWFMYLDDDEWFENPQEIVSFFVSGEYKEYNCASYIQRNYQDPQGILYDDSYPSRMIRLGPDTKFVGIIHEYLSPYKLPKKTFSDFVHHYGYVYKDAEEEKKHSQRNIIPLMEMRRRRLGDPRWTAQLAQEYFGIRDFEKTVEVCKEGLEEWSARKDQVEYAPAHVGALYGYILISYESMETPEAYEEEKLWLEKAIADPATQYGYMEPSVAFFCMAGARLYNNLGEHEQCRKYFRRYVDYVKRLKNNRDIVEAGAAAIVADVFQEQLVYAAVLRCTESIIRTEDYGLVEEAFGLMDWQDSRLLCQEQWESKMVDACCCVDYHPVWVRIIQTLVSRPHGMEEMHRVFLERELAYRQEELGGGLKLVRMHRIISELELEHIDILCAKIMMIEQEPEAVGYEERRQKLAALFQELFRKYPEQIMEVRTDVWNMAERHQILMAPLLMGIDYRQWRHILERWSQKAEARDFQKWDARMELWREQSNALYDVSASHRPEKYTIRYDLFAVKCLEGYLRCYQEICPALEELEQVLWKYADSVLALVTPYYKDFVLEEMPEALPDEVLLAQQLKRLQHYREQRDDLRTLEGVRKCLGIYPEADKTITDYAKMLRDAVQNWEREASEAQVELRHLIATLKQAARLQIERGEHQGAKEILLQIQQCAPEDAEVKELLEQI